MVYGVHAIGGSKAAALSYLLLLRFILFVPITVVGFIVLLTRYGGLARVRDALRSTRAAAEPTRLAREMRAPAAQLRPLRRREDRLCRVPSRGGERGADTLGPVLWRRATSMPGLIAACLVIAALIAPRCPRTPTYDPWAWILWGREIAHLDLVTEGGPSWKPLPIIFTTVFSLFGDHAAPYLWLVVARAGGLLACVMAYRVARRLIGGGWYGVLAGVFAALALFSSFKFVRDAALGNSEALLAALMLWAFERHLDGRRDHALYLGVAGALLRPEVWPFLGLYCLWLWFAEPRAAAPHGRCSARSCPPSGSCPSGGGRATPSGPVPARTTRTRAAPPSRSTRRWRSPAASARW